MHSTPPDGSISTLTGRTGDGSPTRTGPQLGRFSPPCGAVSPTVQLDGRRTTEPGSRLTRGEESDLENPLVAWPVRCGTGFDLRPRLGGQRAGIPVLPSQPLSVLPEQFAQPVGL